MTRVEFPKILDALLAEGDLQGPIRSLADRVGEILADNKLPFFPDYTDHGIDHINAVLKSEVELIPKNVLENSKKDSEPRVVCDADAAVIIGATLLHDIAMHLRPDGFLELVRRESRFHPLPWFKESHEGHPADAPWHDLWENYQREARRFSDGQLGNIIGEDAARVWKFDELPAETGRWERNHCLIVGEFIRRHHARLAHEISIYGFPGLPVGSGESQFPAMGKEEGHPLLRLADLIGLTARSHGTSLRVCKAYLDASPLYPGTPRPMNTAVLYPMALLRVADYLQIDRQRAPAVLLQLRNPQSPISIQEWKKHRAVQHIGPANDPRGKMVTVTTELSLSLYLQLKDLLAGLQAEMDHSTAVLDEAYGTMTELGLHQLNLGIRRVYSNLQSPAFRDSLPYVPTRSGFTADPNLLTLLVEPLYGSKPGVGVRELMQNAVDAVSELEAWGKVRKVAIQSLELPELDGDVLVEYIKRGNGTWFLRVRDRGIGMRSDTIQNYFLRAGASFRRSAEWANEFLDEKGQPRVLRAGRFGIGVFAVFLLGPSFKLWTRHAEADRAMGYAIDAAASSELIEIRRVDGLPVGTTVEVDLSSESVKELELEEKFDSGDKGPKQKVSWFCWDWPKVTQRVIRGRKPELLEQIYTCPVRLGKLPPDWSVIHPNGFDAVFWTFGHHPTLSCNGFIVSDGPPELNFFSLFSFHWPGHAQLERPRIAVLDSAGCLPLAANRYRLSQNTLSFVDNLVRDVTLSYIAHALLCGPKTPREALSTCSGHPLKPAPVSDYEGRRDYKMAFVEGRLRWCVTSEAMVPADPSLYGLLGAESCLVYGALGLDDPSEYAPRLGMQPVPAGLLQRAKNAGVGILPWYGCLHAYGSNRIDRANEVIDVPERILRVLANKGVPCLGSSVGAHVLVSAISPFHFTHGKRTRPPMGRHEDGGLNQAPRFWTEVAHRNSPNDWFKAQVGGLNGSIPMEPILEALESATQSEGKGRRRRARLLFERENVAALFVAEVRTRGANSPKSILAKIWKECIGEKAIPFNPVAREALIAEGSNHPELKRHLDAWKQMERTGSKWVTGG